MLYNLKMKHLQNLKNTIDFFLRQHFAFSRNNYYEKNEDKDGLFIAKEIIEHEKFLLKKYDLTTLKNNSTRQNYLENLYTIDLLDRLFDIDFKDNLKVLDIGCKNWFYAQGEYSFFKKHCSSLAIDGIEIDVNRLYSNFFSRNEAAKFYKKNLDGANYIKGDFLRHNKKYDYIVWILPFVVEYPHLKWGLPRKYFKPEKMLMHAYNSLNDGGKMLIINQGEIEYDVQKKFCEKLKIPYFELGELKSDFLDYEIKRYGLLIKSLTKG